MSENSAQIAMNKLDDDQFTRVYGERRDSDREQSQRSKSSSRRRDTHSEGADPRCDAFVDEISVEL